MYITQREILKKIKNSLAASFPLYYNDVISQSLARTLYLSKSRRAAVQNAEY